MPGVRPPGLVNCGLFPQPDSTPANEVISAGSPARIAACWIDHNEVDVITEMDHRKTGLQVMAASLPDRRSLAASSLPQSSCTGPEAPRLTRHAIRKPGDLHSWVNLVKKRPGNLDRTTFA